MVVRLMYNSMIKVAMFSLLLIFFSLALRAQSKDVDRYICGEVIPTHIIYNIHGLTLSKQTFQELDLQKKQIRSVKDCRLFVCDRIIDKRTGIILYENDMCIDTVLKVYRLKASIEVNGKLVEDKIKKTVTLSQIEPDSLISIKNIKPDETYKGKVYKRGMLILNLRNKQL